MASTDVLALQVAAMEAQLVKLGAKIDTLTEKIDEVTTPKPAEPVATPADFDPETAWWPRPTVTEYLAGAGLPTTTNPADTWAIYRLARVGRLVNGELRCSWGELMGAYDYLDKLKAGGPNPFVSEVEHPSSPGAQQAICTTKLNGLEVMYQPDFPVGFGAKFEWWGLADCCKAAIGDRVAGQG